MTDEQFTARYQGLAHALQSGVAFEMQFDERDTTKRATAGTSPKMLRTGVNMSMVEGSALAQLLIAKGVITKDEYHVALIVALEAEVERYEATLGKRLGRPVKLA